MIVKHTQFNSKKLNIKLKPILAEVVRSWVVVPVQRLYIRLDGATNHNKLSNAYCIVVHLTNLLCFLHHALSTLRRLSDTPGAGGGARKDGLPASLTRPGGRPASSQPAAEVDPQTILKALFKSSGQTPTTTEPPNSQATAFRIKI